MNYLTNNPLITISIIIAVIGLLLWLISSINMMKKDIKRLNSILNKITYELGETDNLTNELKNLISSNRKYEAIKKYRIITGVGLTEAKEYIDSLNN